MADAAASKAAEATHVGSTPTFPTMRLGNSQRFLPLLYTDCTRALFPFLALLKAFVSGQGATDLSLAGWPAFTRKNPLMNLIAGNTAAIAAISGAHCAFRW